MVSSAAFRKNRKHGTGPHVDHAIRRRKDAQTCLANAGAETSKLPRGAADLLHEAGTAEAPYCGQVKEPSQFLIEAKLEDRGQPD